jgi:hypothetical protein
MRNLVFEISEERRGSLLTVPDKLLNVGQFEGLQRIVPSDLKPGFYKLGVYRKNPRKDSYEVTLTAQPYDWGYTHAGVVHDGEIKSYVTFCAPVLRYLFKDDIPEIFWLRAIPVNSSTSNQTL